MSNNVTDLSRCQATKADGTSCERIVGAGQQYCYAHHPARAEERSKNASTAARSKTGTEIRQVKLKLRNLADDVLAGSVDRGTGSVAAQIWGVYLKAVETEIREREAVVREGELELKRIEQVELVKRLEELEETLLDKEGVSYFGA